MKKIGADTNLIVRFLVRDDEDQAEKVMALFESGHQLYINEVVLSELYWVLTKVYDYQKNHFVYALDSLLETEGFHFFDAGVVRKALGDYIHSSTEFSDCLIHQINADRNLTTFTFDKRAAGLKKMNVLE